MNVTKSGLSVSWVLRIGLMWLWIGASCGLVCVRYCLIGFYKIESLRSGDLGGRYSFFFHLSFHNSNYYLQVGLVDG